MDISKQWILKHFLLTATVASYSKDDSTKCGAVIVRPDNSICSTGYNGFPRGVKDNISARKKRPNKYLYTEHSERNAIYNSHDGSMEGYSIFVYTYPNKLTICSDCARAIIQSGITSVYLRSNDTLGHWEDSCQAGLDMFRESGVDVNFTIVPDMTELTTIMENTLKNA